MSKQFSTVYTCKNKECGYEITVESDRAQPKIEECPKCKAEVKTKEKDKEKEKTE